MLGRGEARTCVVTAGMSASEIAGVCRERGVVDDEKALVRWFVSLGLDRHLLPGVYTLRSGSPWEVAKQIEDADPTVLNTTVIPGMNVRTLAARLRMPAPEEEKMPAVEGALADEDNFPEGLRGILPTRSDDRIAFLLPQTYALPPVEGGAADALVAEASRLWWENFHDAVEGMEAGELLRKATLASIVEKEAKVDRERKTVAGVFVNRLDRGMPLQSCATVVYAWGERGIRKKRLTNEDLRIPSAYNTYLHAGLPPGPICIPSVPSWKAALNPEEHDYLYFVAGSGGEHIFSETFDQHIKAKNSRN